MKLFKLKGDSSIIKLRLETPIHLDENVNYSLGLSGFYSDNFVKNFVPDAKKNCFGSKIEDICFGFDNGDKTNNQFFQIKEKYYTLDDIKRLFKVAIQEFRKKFEFNENGFELTTIDNLIQIKFPINAYLPEKLVELLGFDNNELTNIFGGKGLIIKADTQVVGIKPPKFRPFDVIEIHCNLVEESFENHPVNEHSHKESEILYSFFPNVEYGSKISEKPNEIDFIPLRKNINKIQNIIITITDGEGNLLNNKKVNNIIYLRLVH